VKVDLRYLGRTEVRALPAGLALSFAPNLARPPVFFDAELAKPVRFREAVSALHEVVLGDLRMKKKDRSRYLEWKKEREREEREIRQRVFREAEKVELARIAEEPIPAGLQEEFQVQHRLYWDARRHWASELQRNDPELFRALVPCDPVVTVAPDVVFFECFSKDESSYGCLTVDRGAFRDETVAGLGTTNVDYSLALFEHFQTLRSYRPTRLLVDPTGFEVKVGERMDYREEKIDLPPSWLRGFGQLQAAMTLPARRVEISVEALYSVLAYLKRHREKTGPRSLRFRLVPGESPVLYLDPWGIPIASRAAAFDGERPEEIKVWGRRRLMTLARVLPLAERIEVALLGSGLPSFWVLHMGEMAFVLALSGWTANDWTSASQPRGDGGRLSGRAGDRGGHRALSGAVPECHARRPGHRHQRSPRDLAGIAQPPGQTRTGGLRPWTLVLPIPAAHAGGAFRSGHRSGAPRGGGRAPDQR